MAEANANKGKETGETPEEGRRLKPKHRFLRRLGVLLITLVVVLGAVSAALLSQGSYLDRVRRWLAYGSGGAEDRYAFAADGSNRYGQIGEYLVVVNQNYIQFLTDDGEAYLARQVQLSAPALDVGGGLAAAYDVGGRNLYVCDQEGERLHLELEEGYGIISASLNEGGYLAVVAQESGYRGAVTVYNAQQEKVFAYRSSSRYLLDAVVSPDNRSVSVAALGEREGTFGTEVLRYELDREESAGETVLEDHVPLTMENVGACCASLSDRELAFLDSGGALAGRFSFGELYLSQYALGGSDFSALLLSHYRSGGSAALCTVGTDGEVIATLDITGEVLDLSAAGAYVGVLYSDSLVLYDRQLQPLHRLEGTDYAGHLLVSADGSALVIAGNTAWRYLP